MGLFDIFKKTGTAKSTESPKVTTAGEHAETSDITDSDTQSSLHHQPVIDPELSAHAADVVNSETEAVKTSKHQSAGFSPGSAQENLNGYYGDLEKTQRLYGMVEVPVEQRDAEWVARFLDDLPLASFRCGTPQVIAGPDGFPYFQLFLPESGVQFQCFVIENMIEDFLLERGYGIVINPGVGQPDWVLSYGDIVNYYLNRSFLVQDSMFSSNKADEVIQQDEKVTVGQPSELILPAETRKLLRDFFVLNGIEDPKILLMTRQVGEELSMDLAFNITPEGFESDEHYRNMMQTVTWYLPRHYSIVGLNDNGTSNGFMPL